jgi:hypothetical protein
MRDQRGDPITEAGNRAEIPCCHRGPPFGAHPPGGLAARLARVGNVSWFTDRRPGSTDKSCREVIAMRYGLLVLGIVLGIGLYQGWLERAYDQATFEALTDDARLAIDVRCSDVHGRAGQDCRSTLKRLYIAGALEPDRTLRAWCESVKTERWQGSRTTPPTICVQRYGGW